MHEIDQKFHCERTYRTSRKPSSLVRLAPAFFFYSRLLLGPLLLLYYNAVRGTCDDVCWANCSKWFTDQIEDLGCPIIVEGLEHLNAMKEPCVFVANHMSTLETFVLPAIIRPFMPVTFVVKDSLVTMPFFGPAMRSRNPVVVGRKNPREDLAQVLTEGSKRLQDGISLIIFPQSTRMQDFDPAQFNSIGEKLAKKAHVPIIPLALKTDAWSTGKRIKELGPIKAGLPVRFRFAEPLRIQGNGKSEHEHICAYITDCLREWSSDRPWGEPGNNDAR